MDRIIEKKNFDQPSRFWGFRTTSYLSIDLDPNAVLTVTGKKQNPYLCPLLLTVDSLLSAFMESWPSTAKWDTLRKNFNLPFISRHKGECRGVLQIGTLLGDGVNAVTTTVESKSKKYVPVHMSGICPYCEHKFCDLLGHIRHGHRKDNERLSTSCSLCCEKFGSVRELVTHRQLHPQFNYHSCQKCKMAKFETVVSLRTHWRKECIKNKNRCRLEANIKKETDHLSGTEGLPTGSVGLSDDKGNNSTASSIAGNDDPRAASTPAIEFSASKPKQAEYEGRGTVCCHLCQRQFTMKQLLRRHYIATHGYDPNLTNSAKADFATPFSASSGSPESLLCMACKQTFVNLHARIRHQLDFHATVSGEICPYCPYTRKFDNLDDHVVKYHEFVMQSPVQTCSTCKLNLCSYEELKAHKQLHDGGSKRVVEIRVSKVRTILK